MALRRAMPRLAVLVLSASALLDSPLAHAAEPEPAAAETLWPHEIATDTVILRVHQPQLESWDGSLLRVRAAVAASAPKDAAPTFGVIAAQARTLVDKQQRIVTLDNVDVVRWDFPGAVAHGEEWARLIEADNALGQDRLLLA